MTVRCRLPQNADAGYAIIESTDNAENKLSQMERIVVGER